MKIPVRTEITVLPADPPRPTLGWKVYMGSPIYRVGLLDTLQVPITDPQGLHVGDTIAYRWNGQLVHMVVLSVEGMTATADDLQGNWRAHLRFTEDDRLCWVSEGLSNLPGYLKRSAVER